MNEKKKMVLELIDKTVTELTELIDKLLEEYDAADANNMWRQIKIMDEVQAARDSKNNLIKLKQLLTSEAK